MNLFGNLLKNMTYVCRMIFTLISKLWIFSKGIPYSTRINGTGSAEKVLSNTSFIVNAVCEGKSVGVVRVLTDKVTDAYITDVIISPDFQGLGLGR